MIDVQAARHTQLPFFENVRLGSSRTQTSNLYSAILAPSISLIAHLPLFSAAKVGGRVQSAYHSSSLSGVTATPIRALFEPAGLHTFIRRALPRSPHVGILCLNLRFVFPRVPHRAEESSGILKECTSVLASGSLRSADYVWRITVVGKHVVIHSDQYAYTHSFRVLSHSYLPFSDHKVSNNVANVISPLLCYSRPSFYWLLLSAVSLNSIYYLSYRETGSNALIAYSFNCMALLPGSCPINRR